MARALDLEQDLKAQRRLWVFQRFGMGLMFLIVAASVLGLTGPGVFSDVKLGDPSSLEVEFERSLHYRNPSELRVQIPAQNIQDGKAYVAVERSWVEKANIERVSPEPETVEIAGDEYRYTFAAVQPGHPLHAVFHINPEDRGRLSGQMRSALGEPVAIRQFVFP